MTELLPCPFCGSSDIEAIDTFDWVACRDCGASLEDAEPSSRALWNKRSDGPPATPLDAKGELIMIAAECHRTKWQFDLSEDYQPSKSAARALILQAFHELHRIGDLALKARDALVIPRPAPEVPAAAQPDYERLREALNAVVNWYTPPNDSNPFPIKIVVEALSQIPRPNGNTPEGGK